MRDTDWLMAHLDAAVSIMRTHPNTSRHELANRLRLSGPEIADIFARLERIGIIKGAIGARQP
jgi:DNA-binding Lrp family transcriptional regulator